MKNIININIFMLFAILFMLSACRIFKTRDLREIQYSMTPTVFTSQYNHLFTVQYSDNGQYVLLGFNGVQHELKNTVSASGARYTNKDESVVFWSKAFWDNREGAFIEIDGEIVLRYAAMISE